MKKIFKAPGFPTEISESIELPRIEEFLLSPMFHFASLDDVYKHGGEINRMLINKLSLKNNTKYVVVSSYTQFLNPSLRSIASKAGYDIEWHIDGSKNPFITHDRFHLLISDCTARTEFNTNQVDILLDEKATIQDLHRILQEEQEKGKIKLIPQKIECNKIVSFKNHIHRSIVPERPEFRFMFRVIETNSMQPKQLEESKINCSPVYMLKEKLKSIEQLEDKIIIHNVDF